MAKKQKEKVKNSYIFPDFMAEFMSKVDQRTQYEASMMSMSFMAIGLVVTMVYVFMYVDFQLWYKIFLVVNALAGLLFMWSFLVTTYQQYRTYMASLEQQEEQKHINTLSDEELKKMEEDLTKEIENMADKESDETESDGERKVMTEKEVEEVRDTTEKEEESNKDA